MQNFAGLTIHLTALCGLMAAVTLAFDNSVDVKPEAMNDGDVIIDDMIYGREQYIKDYFNLR